MLLGEGLGEEIGSHIGKGGRLAAEWTEWVGVLGFLGLLRCVARRRTWQVLISANVAGWQGTDRVASHKLVYLGRGWQRCEA